MSPFHMTKWAFTAHIQSTKKRDKGFANILCWMPSTYILWYIKLTGNVQKLNVCLKMQYALQCGFHAVNFIVSELWLFLHSPFPKRFWEHTSCPAGGSVIKHMKTKALFWDSLKTLSLIYCAFGRLPRQIVHELSRSRGKWHTHCELSYVCTVHLGLFVLKHLTEWQRASHLHQQAVNSGCSLPIKSVKDENCSCIGNLGTVCTDICSDHIVHNHKNTSVVYEFCK